ncbi:hypothetical protein [Wolbachia endosymbiont (group A) of Anomoia purmunda]|uniref:hypothetical protein n=1 Tax=Wolbachia endosymbiont (group A) of Anomoia purmunda TaxID=2953978 RepID=UPI002230587B|nr:hypothetical protein [Wolbachia endosymbiont (group A) of Anomoia purmunda]
MAESIWAKIGGAVKTGVKATGRVFALVPKALIYPIRKPFASTGEMKHDATVSLKKVVNINVPEEEKEYDPPIETTQASKNLGVQITEQKKGTGKVSFLASRTLTGDIPYLSPEQLDKIKKGLPNITIFREENKIVIEVDVEKIIKKIKDDNPGINEKAIKELALKEIFNKVDCNLKGLAKITGGEFKIHTDLKLLNGIAEKLYKEYDNQKQSLDKVVKSDVGQPSETIASGKKKWAQEAIKAGKSQSCGM